MKTQIFQAALAQSKGWIHSDE